MKIKIVAFGIAKDILGTNRLDFEWNDGQTVKHFKTALIDKYPNFRLLASLSLAVNKDYINDDFLLSEHDEVILIPPVSGG